MVDPGSYWDEKYRGDNRIWGDDPSELAIVATRYLRAQRGGEEVDALDVGCGYGRDTVYLARTLGCRVLGVDLSQEAIRMARTAFVQERGVTFSCCDFAEIGDETYDVVLVSNLYHLLETEERERLAKTIASLLAPRGLLFLGALSTSDRQDYGKGDPIPGEPHSFRGKAYRHFATRGELEEGLGFLTIRELAEHEYHEPHAAGEDHDHVAWIVIGEREE
jgi:SAM-dependent methyltransferase